MSLDGKQTLGRPTIITDINSKHRILQKGRVERYNTEGIGAASPKLVIDLSNPRFGHPARRMRPRERSA